MSGRTGGTTAADALWGDGGAGRGEHHGGSSGLKQVATAEGQGWHGTSSDLLRMCQGDPGGGVLAIRGARTAVVRVGGGRPDTAGGPVRRGRHRWRRVVGETPTTVAVVGELLRGRQVPFQALIAAHRCDR
ncbi:hypothetical protein NKG94_08415 [Micromonospora sp. M12]